MAKVSDMLQCARCKASILSGLLMCRDTVVEIVDFNTGAVKSWNGICLCCVRDIRTSNDLFGQFQQFFTKNTGRLIEMHLEAQQNIETGNQRFI